MFLPSSRFPAEIWVTICSEVHDSASLASLCRISRSCRPEAQRILYHSVDLRDRPMRAIQLWARTMIGTPLAERVYALALCLPGTLRFDVSHATKIGRALAKCVNLKELRMVSDEELIETAGDAQYGVHGWLINNCSFRLTKFENFHFEDRRIAEFWKNQTELQVLLTRTCSFLRDPVVLPQLNAIEAADLLDLSERRSLQRVSTRLDDTNLRRLARCTTNLTTLYLSRDSVDRWFSIGDAIATAAGCFPDLIHFAIVEKQDDVPSHEEVSNTTLEQFLKLETLVLQVLNISCFDIDGATHEMNTAAGLYGLGNGFMMACPALRRATIRAEMGGQVLAIMVTRSQGGEIDEGSQTVVDFDTSCMLWNQ
ncbi:F-box domain-containing protein [Mycena sanguinolenta]|uniref:F-box domain-containing protein n=1 Tax=Mycena sanguinolenta TaxID=230812 RepID=A0A8H6X7D2_9AGAR|nr:F-box domain-containing protein [Mycena sanguinolenta]